MSRRGARITVPNFWLDAVEKWRKDHGMTQADLGLAAARASGRSRAFSAAAISRYLAGAVVTQELTDALARATCLPNPVFQVDNQDLLAWCHTGQRLQRLSPSEFARELSQLTALVDALEVRRKN